MIIESGHDLRLVLGPVESQIALNRICILPLDAELRLLSVITLVPDPDEPHILDAVPAIASLLFHDAPEARYLALAWASDRESGRDAEWLRDLDDRIRGDGLLGPVRLLGQIVFTPDGTAITVPECDFALYPELSDLPRVVSVPGPHDDGCCCPACERDRRLLRQQNAEWRLLDEDYRAREEEDDLRAWYEDHHGWGVDAYPRWEADGYRSWGVDDSHRAWAADEEFSRARERKSPNFHARWPSLYVAPQASPEIDDTPRYDPFWNRWFPEPERAHKKWTPDEEHALQRAHAEGMSCFDISILLHRQPGAIAGRLNRLGLSARTVVPGEDHLLDAADAPEMPPMPRTSGGREPTLFDD